MKTRLFVFEVSSLLLTFAIALTAYRLDKAAEVIVQQNVNIAKLNEDNSRLQGIIDSMEPSEPVRGPVCPDDELETGGVTARSIALANM
jgi:hypothetical protein